MCDILQSVKEQLQEIENECNSPSTECKDLYEQAQPELMSMPVEIILKIFSFLDADYLKVTLSKVCTRFDTILRDVHVWRFWVQSKMGDGCYPAIPNLQVWKDVKIDWEAVSVEMASEKRKWENVKDTMRHIVVKDVHFASVDTVLLVNKGEFCISGGRDRGMALWNVLDIKPNHDSDNHTTFADVKPRHIRHDAHAGWVWDLSPDRIENTSVVYSASWDNTVKAWDLESGFTCVETFRCGMSALSVVTCENVVMAGLYSRKILSFDLRAGPMPINSYKAHKGPVLALDSFNNKVASVSEDKTLAVWDRVAGKTLVTDVKMPTDKAYPVCVSWDKGAMYIGDSKGSLHLIHPVEHRYMKSHEIWPEPPIVKPPCKITGCFQTDASLILCSDRGEIKFLYNSYPPEEYVTVRSTTFDVTQLRYLNGILVIGTCDSALEFWVPNEKYPDLGC